MLPAQTIGRTEIHSHAVLDDAVLLQNLIEHFERPSAIDHEIFRDDLEPIDNRFLGKNVSVMRHAQTDADSVFGEIIECVSRHVRDRYSLGPESRGVKPRPSKTLLIAERLAR